MQRVPEEPKKLSRLEKAAIIITLFIFLCLGVYMWVNMTDDLTAHSDLRLSDFTEDKLKSYLKKNTSIDILFVKVNRREGSVSVIDFDDNDYDENGVVYIAARDSKAIMSRLFKFVGVNKVKVVQAGTFASDKGGNEVDPAVSITLTRAKANKINWDTVNTNNKAELISLASDLYIDPAVKEQINDKDILDAIVKQISSN